MFDQREELVEDQEFHFQFHRVDERMDSHFEGEHVLPGDSNESCIEQNGDDLRAYQEDHDTVSLLGVCILEELASCPNVHPGNDRFLDREPG